MSIDLEEWQQLKKKAADLKRKADEAAGARDQLLKQLRKEHGVATLEEAKAKLAKMEKQAAKDEAEYERALAAFREKHGDKLEDDHESS